MNFPFPFHFGASNLCKDSIKLNTKPIKFFFSSYDHTKRELCTVRISMVGFQFGTLRNAISDQIN